MMYVLVSSATTLAGFWIDRLGDPPKDYKSVKQNVK